MFCSRRFVSFEHRPLAKSRQSNKKWEWIKRKARCRSQQTFDRVICVKLIINKLESVGIVAFAFANDSSHRLVRLSFQNFARQSWLVFHFSASWSLVIRFDKSIEEFGKTTRIWIHWNEAAIQSENLQNSGPLFSCMSKMKAAKQRTGDQRIMSYGISNAWSLNLTNQERKMLIAFTPLATCECVSARSKQTICFIWIKGQHNIYRS